MTVDSGRRWILDTAKDVFRILGLELTFGGGLVGACPRERFCSSLA